MAQDRTTNLRFEAFKVFDSVPVSQSLDFVLEERVNCARGSLDSVNWQNMIDPVNAEIELVSDGQTSEAFLSVAKNVLYTTCTLHFAIVSSDLPVIASKALSLQSN